MMSPTHTLLALALFTKKDKPVRNWSVFIGSVIPDSFIYVAWIVLTFFMQVEQEIIWREIYFDDPMQTIAAIFNSVPLYLLVLLIGFLNRQKLWGKAVMFFGLAALSHIALDFPVHNHDAYAHFWPLSEYRFFSPVSYYEEHLHGDLVGTVDAAIAIISCLVLWRRFEKHWVRGILATMIFGMSFLTLLRLDIVSLSWLFGV